MPTFDTPQPISLNAELFVGDVWITASDRADTVVEIRPTDASKKADVDAAGQTRVEFANDRLTIKAPRTWRQWAPTKGGESIEVHIDVPTESQIRVKAGVASLHCTGQVASATLETGVGDIHVVEATSVQVKTGVGDVDIDRVTGRAEIRTGSGTIGVGAIEGPAVIKNANGDTWVGEATTDLRVSAANGKISVDRAEGTVGAKSACGDVRIGDVAHGTVAAHSGFGGIDVGVRDGVAAWLDLETKFGRVESALDAAGPPAAGEETVEVRARTSFGDITIHRAIPMAAGTDRG